MTATATKQARTLVSRAVIWAGLALGTCLTVLAVMNGIRVPRLEVVLSVIATWALLTVLAVVAVELLRRHHRAIGRHAVRYGKRGAVATARGARAVGRGAAARSRPWRTRVLAALRARWAARGSEPLMFRRTAGAAGPAPGGRNLRVARPGRNRGRPGRGPGRPGRRRRARPGQPVLVLGSRGQPVRLAGGQPGGGGELGAAHERRRKAVRGHRVPARRRPRHDGRHLCQRQAITSTEGTPWLWT